MTISKKKIVKTTIIFAVIAAIAATIIIWNSDWGWRMRVTYVYEHRTYNEVFDGYEKDFQSVADFLLSHRDTAVNESNMVLLFHENGRAYFHVSESNPHVALDTKTDSSLQKMMEAFSKQGLDCEKIRVDENRVAFIIENDDYALVYSEDDSRPTFVFRAERELGYRYYVKKIMKHWYGITGIS